MRRRLRKLRIARYRVVIDLTCHPAMVLAIELSADDLATLEKAVPAEAVAGTRYQEMLTKHLDSER